MPDNKNFKSGIRRMTDAQLTAATRPHPFKKCVCGNSIPASAQQCGECSRLYELGMKTPPVPQFVQPNPSMDTTPAASYPSHRHDGFSTTRPTGKIDPARERF